MNLTQQIYLAIVDHHRRFGQVPQRDELQKNFCQAAGGPVDVHLAALAHDGLILLDRDQPGCFSLADRATRSMARIGIQGHRPAVGGPTEAGAEAGTISVDLEGIGLPLGEDAYALQVSDDSMLDAGIQPGDIAILTPGAPLRGNIVAAMIDGRLVLRRFLVIRGIPHLLAENPTRPELCAAYDIQLEGVLCALLRVNFGRPCLARDQQPAVSYLAGATTDRPAPVKPASSRRVRWPLPPAGIALNEPAAGFGTKNKKKRRGGKSGSARRKQGRGK